MANTTWNPSDLVNVTLSGGNLVAVNSASQNGGVRTIDRQITGSFYWEETFPGPTTTVSVGVANAAALMTSAYSTGLGTCYVWSSTGGVFLNSASPSSVTLGSLSAGATVGIAWRGDLNQIWFRVAPAGNWNGSATANPATGVGGFSIAAIGGGGIPVYPIAMSAASGTRQVTANFGDSAFTGAVPAGFTSGFTAGASVPTNELLTQIAAEQWGTGTPDFQLTQIAIEEWAQVSTVNPYLVLTQIALEEWASVTVVSGSVGAPIITMIG